MVAITLIRRCIQIRNILRSIFDAEGIAIPKSFKAWMAEGLAIFQVYTRPMNGKLKQADCWRGILCVRKFKVYDAVCEQVAQSDKALRVMVKACPKTRRLMTIFGVGQHLAEVMVCVLDDVNRFASAKEVAGHAGLAPRIKE